MAQPTGPLAQIDGERGELGRVLLEALFPAPPFREDVEAVVAEVAEILPPPVLKQLVGAVEHGMLRTSGRPLLQDDDDSARLIAERRAVLR